MSKVLFSLVILVLVALTTQTKTSGYSQKRSKCSNWKCKDFDKSQSLLREMCLHQCVDEICFNKTYEDLANYDENSALGKLEEAIQKEQRKNKFLECFEGPRKKKSYAEMRSDCSRWSCGDIDKDAKMMRDQCIHECMSASCYYQVYQDIDGAAPDFLNDQVEEEDRNQRKNKFKQCFDDLYGDGTNQQKQKKAQKSYQELRSDCSAKQCKQVDKEDKFGRDLCLHKCVSAECYAMSYDMDISELSYNSPEEEEEDRVVRKEVFIQCVEADFPKNVEERKEGCIYRGACKDMEKNTFEREICLSECIHPKCYQEIYSSTTDQPEEPSEGQDEQELDLQRDNLKKLFVECVEKNLTENRKSRKFKTYVSKRDECAPGCAHIDKENTMERDLCIHKCINITCYYQNYGQLNMTKYLWQRPEKQEQQRELLKENFINCSEKDLPKEIKAKKYLRRLKTCEWKYTFQTPYMNQQDIDDTLFKCINKVCFQYIFEKYIDNATLSLAYSKVSEEEKESLKDSFIDCVENGSPRLLKTYEELRVECINTNNCHLLEKDKKLQRDMCAHQCIDQECFKQSYGEYTYRMPRYKYKKDEKNDLIKRKNQFKKCIKEKAKIRDDEEITSEENIAISELSENNEKESHVDEKLDIANEKTQQKKDL